jgi:hypothetical protein
MNSVPTQRSTITHRKRRARDVTMANTAVSALR